MKKVMYTPLLFLAIVFAFAGCSSDTSGPAKNVSITNLEWIANNIALDYWTTPPSDGSTAFYSFYINYEGNIGASDVSSATVAFPGTDFSWIIASSSDTRRINAASEYIGGGYFYDSDTPHVLPIGQAKATIRLANGTSSSLERTIAAPGSSSVGTYTTTHDEDYVGTPPATSAPLLLRATASSPSKDADSVSILFSVADDIAHNGVLWFFDADDNYVGVTPLFRDPSGEALQTAYISSFNTDGTANSVDIDAGDIEYLSGYAFADIASCRVVLFDGAQYEPKDTFSFDSRSVSSKYSF